MFIFSWMSIYVNSIKDTQHKMLIQCLLDRISTGIRLRYAHLAHALIANTHHPGTHLKAAEEFVTGSRDRGHGCFASVQLAPYAAIGHLDTVDQYSEIHMYRSSTFI